MNQTCRLYGLCKHGVYLNATLQCVDACGAKNWCKEMVSVLLELFTLSNVSNLARPYYTEAVTQVELYEMML